MNASSKVPIGQLVNFIGGGTPSRQNADYYGGSIPWVTPKDMKRWDITDAQVRITEQGLQNSAARMAPEGAVLVVVRSGVLKHTLPVGIAKVPVAINQDMKALICSPDINSDYLAHYIKYKSPEILGWVRATTADNFPVDKLKHLKIPLPALKEQQRIAEILDEADALRAARRSTIQTLDSLEESAFVEYFGNPERNPGEWPLENLATVLQIPLRNGLSPSSTGMIEGRVLTLSAITGRAFNQGSTKAAKFNETPSKNHLVDARDFLICRGNGNLDLVGRGAFPSESMPDTTFPDTAIAARVRPDKLLPSFMQRIWHSRLVRRQIEVSARTTNGTFKVNQGALEKIEIVIPPLERQEAFSRYAVHLSEVRQVQQEQLSELEALFEALRDRAFRGEL
ncbi:type I restriction enzyme S subunit [Actinoplanes octamycinicus]|uniref:Type I restriction enzyme S subunit n=1 Tax=Actinoplanes octamycinicus TaxID=135948 RepID=A0A7W7GVF2_9ACTN|nr:restriction endonuclease subunit S [Actinoplanes octamycinicus]MBB4739031.1 type I restriction enzyme S subunit [Actinoplanes octamycinicus]GIE60160.1 type I restriction modification enzyme protein S [Actinoplanes octamycinicus]